jgi:hypothetical protein
MIFITQSGRTPAPNHPERQCFVLRAQLFFGVVPENDAVAVQYTGQGLFDFANTVNVSSNAEAKASQDD